MCNDDNNFVLTTKNLQDFKNLWNLFSIPNYIFSEVIKFHYIEYKKYMYQYQVQRNHVHLQIEVINKRRLI